MLVQTANVPNLRINRQYGGGLGSALAQAGFILPLNDLGAGEVNLVPTRAAAPTPTFTRATTRTTIGSTGLVIPVGSGVAASYYDPTTLAYMGYLAEGARTNLALRSEEFDNASWSKTDVTITADNTTSPDGTANADLFTEGTAGTATTGQAVTATADVNYAASWWAKRGNTDWLMFSLNNGANRVNGWVNVATGAAGSTAVTGTGVAVGITVKAYPNGWYRCALVGSVMSGATAIALRIQSATANSNTTPVNNATYYAWGAQFENNVSFASSYIPTQGSTVTRNADVLTYAFAGNASATAGTAYAELGTEWIDPGATAGAIYFSNAQGRPLYRPAGVASSTSISIFDNTAAQNKTGLTDMSTASRKRGSAWGGSVYGCTGDGATVQSGAFDGSLGPGTGNIGIGCNPSGVGNEWFGTLKNVRIWTSQLSDAQLQAITS